MCNVADVAVENVQGTNILYSYYIPADLASFICVGSRVLVPFGSRNSLRTAFVVDLRDEKNVLGKLKFIDSILDEIPLVRNREVELARWMSDFYFCSVFDSLNAFLPVQIKNKKFICNESDLIVSDFSFTDINLSFTQERIFDKLCNWMNSSEVNEALLYGVTGSGKTSVFLKLAQKVISEGKNVVILVPEISLIPQMISNIEKFFGSKTFACIHSGLTPKKRAIEWTKIRNGFAKLVVGTRSAVLSPFDKVDLIVIDEEQEATYKSDSTPRFHARNVAQFLCEHFGSKLLLASATPSVESFFHAKSGEKLLLELKERYGNASLPSVKLVNIKRNRSNVNAFLSDELIDAIFKTLSEDKQVILLLDRRGFHTLVRCVECGSPVICENCNLTLSHHIINKKDKLICHYCGFSEDIPSVCKKCGGNKISLTGVGTQNLENEISSIIRSAKCLRVDADTTKSKKAYEKLFSDFREKKFNIMIGTRMVAKGLDFSDVTLVGVICADQALFGEEYKAYEKMFALVSQVVGRSGRSGTDGVALIQTFSGDNPIIKIASKQDYDLFFENEIIVRKNMLYPPFVDICLIGFVGPEENSTKNACILFFKILNEEYKKNFFYFFLKILLPSSAFLKKAFNKFRFKIMVKCNNNEDFRNFLSKVLERYKKTSSINGIFVPNKIKSKINVFFDFNPENVF